MRLRDSSLLSAPGVGRPSAKIARVTAVLVALILTATGGYAQPPVGGAGPPTKLTGTLRAEIEIPDDTSPTGFRAIVDRRSYNVLQLPDGEAFGTVTSQGTKSAPHQLDVHVTHMKVTRNADGSNGAWICGSMSGHSIGLEIPPGEEVRVVTAVFDSGLPGGRGDANTIIIGLPSFLDPLRAQGCSHFKEGTSLRRASFLTSEHSEFLRTGLTMPCQGT